MVVPIFATTSRRGVNAETAFVLAHAFASRGIWHVTLKFVGAVTPNTRNLSVLA